MLITIGAFDGFHKGHAELMEICRKNSIKGDWGVVTFYPHPSKFLHTLNNPLFTLQERELIRRILGIPEMFVIKFDEALKNLSPEKFWERLRRRINIDGLVMGSDFHFGLERSGNAESLENLARSQGINKIFIAELLDKKNYSSSRIREKIFVGEVKEASKLLGYDWFMISSVIHGNERGRTLNFPTANIKLKTDKLIPAYGVYSTAVLVKGEWHCGALSIGNNPTFHDVKETRAEVNILNYSGDIYGDEVIIYFLDRIRGIKTFPDKKSLISQIENDVKICEEIYNNSMNEREKFFESAKKIYLNEKLTTEIIKLT